MPRARPALLPMPDPSPPKPRRRLLPSGPALVVAAMICLGLALLSLPN